MAIATLHASNLFVISRWRLPLAWRFLLMNMALDGIFFVPIAIAYYQLKGADLGAFLFLQGLFRLCMLVFEVPTGLLSDRWNRSYQLIAGGVIWIIQLIVLWGSSDYTGLLIAEVLAALSFCLRSGTTEAYLHEIIITSHEPEATAKWQSRLYAGSLIMETFAYVSGGWLFGIAVEAPLIATLIFACIGLFIALGLPKASIKANYDHKNAFKDIWMVLCSSLRGHPKVPWLILGPPVLFGCSAVIFWSVQSRLLDLGVSTLWMGIALGTTCLFKAIMAMTTEYLMKRLGEAWLVISLPVLSISGMLLVALPNIAILIWLGGLLGAGAVHSVGRPFIVCMINKEVSDSIRATVLSLATFTNTVIAGLFLVASKPLLDVVELKSALLLFLALTLGTAIYPLYRLARICR